MDLPTFLAPQTTMSGGPPPCCACCAMLSSTSPAACCHSGGRGATPATGALGSLASQASKPRWTPAVLASAASPSRCCACCCCCCWVDCLVSGVPGGPTPGLLFPGALPSVNTAVLLAARGTVPSDAPGSSTSAPPHRSSAHTSTQPLAAVKVQPKVATSPLCTSRLARPTSSSACRAGVNNSRQRSVKIERRAAWHAALCRQQFRKENSSIPSRHGPGPQAG